MRAVVLQVQYGDAHYWDERYAKSTAEFEWYESYEPLQGLLRDFAPQDQPILQVRLCTGTTQHQYTYTLHEDSHY